MYRIDRPRECCRVISKSITYFVNATKCQRVLQNIKRWAYERISVELPLAAIRPGIVYSDWRQVAEKSCFAYLSSKSRSRIWSQVSLDRRKILKGGSGSKSV
jgi:hypothetical protein